MLKGNKTRKSAFHSYLLRQKLAWTRFERLQWSKFFASVESNIWRKWSKRKRL